MGFNRFRLILGVTMVVSIVALACSASIESEEVSPTPPLPTNTPSQTPASTPQDTYDPQSIMFRILPDLSSTFQPRLDATLREVLARNDTYMVPVLIEALRFFPTQPMAESGASALRQLTGQDFETNDWDSWMIWYGRNRDSFPPPEGYLSWKSNFMSQIHPRLGDFLRSAEDNLRIDLTEVVWGGVIPDGIPDLVNPPNIPATQNDYLEPDERVFGVSINGESRAYPLRIMNAHEMANDVLGGEPIALAY